MHVTGLLFENAVFGDGGVVVVVDVLPEVGTVLMTSGAAKDWTLREEDEEDEGEGDPVSSLLTTGGNRDATLGAVFTFSTIEGNL